MLFIKNDNTNPYLNHAVEEYLLENFEDDCFMLWQNEPSILVGKNQNTLSEINLDYVKNNNLAVVRRLSGGGAIYGDLGNLYFTFITTLDKNSFTDFKKFTDPILRALKKLNLNAELSGRNDLVIDGKKFSGNAQHIYNNKILHHGSILFSTDMSKLTSALKVKNIKFTDKAIKSVESRVINLANCLPNPMDILEFKDFLLKSAMEEFSVNSLFELSPEHWDEIKRISDKKYATWEWNYGNSPEFNFSNEKKFLGGVVQINLNVDNGIINDIKFYGDFFSRGDIKELENNFIGIKYKLEEIRKVLNKVNVETYMANITGDNLVDLMFN